jgi:hypothetical protein
MSEQHVTEVFWLFRSQEANAPVGKYKFRCSCGFESEEFALQSKALAAAMVHRLARV